MARALENLIRHLAEIQNAPFTEHHTRSILMYIRQHLEYSKSTEYPTLKFWADWSAHSQLNRASAARVLNKFADCLREYDEKKGNVDFPFLISDYAREYRIFHKTEIKLEQLAPTSVIHDQMLTHICRLVEETPIKLPTNKKGLSIVDRKDILISEMHLKYGYCHMSGGISLGFNIILPFKGAGANHIIEIPLLRDACPKCHRRNLTCNVKRGFAHGRGCDYIPEFYNPTTKKWEPE